MVGADTDSFAPAKMRLSQATDGNGSTTSLRDGHL